MKIDAPSAGAKSAIDFSAFVQMLVCPIVVHSEIDGETTKKDPNMHQKSLMFVCVCV